MWQKCELRRNNWSQIPNSQVPLKTSETSGGWGWWGEGGVGGCWGGSGHSPSLGHSHHCLQSVVPGWWQGRGGEGIDFQGLWGSESKQGSSLVEPQDPSGISCCNNLFQQPMSVEQSRVSAGPWTLSNSTSAHSLSASDSMFSIPTFCYNVWNHASPDWPLFVILHGRIPESGIMRYLC